MEVSKSDREGTRGKELERAAEYASAGMEDKAYEIYASLLNKNFDDAHALYGIARLNMLAERYGEAFNFYRIAAGLKSLGTAPYNGMVHCFAETWDLDAAMALCKKALALDPKCKHALGNMALIHLLRCEPKKALAYGELALEQDVNFTEVFHHMTYAQLMLGKWKQGWEGHQHILGKVKTRTERHYENLGRMLPRWDGEKGKAVLVYGEQGLGDEISFASCIPDLAEISSQVVLDCDHRLESLFKRSFTNVQVHGTRFKNPMSWIDEYQLDAAVAIGDLPRFFRNSDDEFPGQPYLKADPIEIDGVKPVIGIAWNGGLPNTGSVKRSLPLEALLPILKAVPATWVSLEYKGGSDEIKSLQSNHGIEILYRPEARAKNYEETASLVKGLDLVICVSTAVVHLSGALGKECWCLVPSKPRWWYGIEGDKSPWYKSVRFFRQVNDWREPIRLIAKLLKLRFG